MRPAATSTLPTTPTLIQLRRTWPSAAAGFDRMAIVLKIEEATMCSGEVAMMSNPKGPFFPGLGTSSRTRVNFPSRASSLTPLVQPT